MSITNSSSINHNLLLVYRTVSVLARFARSLSLRLASNTFFFFFFSSNPIFNLTISSNSKLSACLAKPWKLSKDRISVPASTVTLPSLGSTRHKYSKLSFSILETNFRSASGMSGRKTMSCTPVCTYQRLVNYTYYTRVCTHMYGIFPPGEVKRPDAESCNMYICIYGAEVLPGSGLLGLSGLLG